MSRQRCYPVEDCDDETEVDLRDLWEFAVACGVEDPFLKTRRELCRAINKRSPPAPRHPWLYPPTGAQPLLMHTQSPKSRQRNADVLGMAESSAMGWLMGIFDKICHRESKDMRMEFRHRLSKYMHSYFVTFGSKIPWNHVQVASLALFYVLGSALGIGESCDTYVCDVEGANCRSHRWNWDQGPVPVVNARGELVQWSWVKLCMEGGCEPETFSMYITHMLTNKKVPFELYAQ